MARRYIDADTEMCRRFFGASYDFTPNRFWLTAVVDALHQVTGDRPQRWTAKGPLKDTFNILTQQNRKLSAFVRWNQEDRQICVGLEKGGRRGYDPDVLADIFSTAFGKIFAQPPPQVEEVFVVAPKPRRKPPVPLPDVVKTLERETRRCEEAFDAAAWGPEYLTLEVGDIVLLLPPPEDAEEWGYGAVLGENGRRAEGWFPPTYLNQD